MDITKLKAIVHANVHDKTLSLPIAQLESDAVTRLGDANFPTNELDIQGITQIIEPPSNDSITVIGTGSSLPFTGMTVTATFSVQGGAAALVVTAAGTDAWTLASSFPMLQNSLLPGLRFAPSPQLSCASYQVSDAIPQGLAFDGMLQLTSALGWLDFLFGGGSQRLHGAVTMANGVAELALAGPVSEQVPVGFFSLPKLTLTLTSSARLNTRRQTYSADVFITIGGSISFQTKSGSHDIPLSLRIFDPGGGALFVADLRDTVGALMDELSSLLDGVGLGDLFAKTPLTLADAVTLTDLVLQVDPAAAHKLAFVTLGVQTTRAWPLVERPGLKDPIAIESIRLLLRLDEPMGARRLGMALSGDIAVGGGVLQLTTTYPDFAFGGGLKSGTAVSVPELVGYFIGANVSDVPNLSVYALDFYVQPLAGTYSARAELVGPWAIPAAGLDLRIEDLVFSIDHPDAATTDVAMAGTFGVAGVDVTISAEHAGPGAGWEFHGSTGQDEVIPIGSLLADLESKFDITLPAALTAAELKNVDVKFNTLTRNFTFACTAVFPVAGGEFDLSVAIAVISSTDATGATTFTRTFDTQLTKGAMTFKLDFASDDTSTSVSASWVDTGTPLRFEDFARAVGFTDLPAIPDSLDLTLKDVTFTYDTAGQALVLTAETAHGRVVFATDQDGAARVFGLGLAIDAALNLSDLPLVKQTAGKVLPAGETVSVEDLKVALASRSFTQANAVRLNDLITRDLTVAGLDPSTYPRLPADAPGGGIVLAASLNLGGTATPLSLSLAGGQSAAAASAGTGVVPAGGTPPAPAAPAAGDSIHWIDVQRGFGPVWFRRIGAGYADQQLNFALDASLSLFALSLSLDGLALSSPLTDFSPHFHLDGLGLTFGNGPLEISGEFLSVKPSGQDDVSFEYDGSVQVKAENFSLSALGSYAVVDGTPSLFIFALLDAPLGGPAFFFVTGLAGGVGYNRRLRLPAPDQVSAFPLIAAATNPAAVTATPPAKPQDGLRLLSQYISPQIGEYWLAAGVRFTSFEIIDSFVVLTVEFGKELEIAVLGLSKLKLPQEEDAFTLVYAELALAVVILPSEGVVRATALLTPNSYVLDPACRLTGGFAFYTWFKDPHAGDFCVTLGGYHPHYSPPSHYPAVPRLGFNWPQGDITISGEAYFALTPSGVMAGGLLSAVYHSGNLRAWFIAQADFLITWKPFYYDIAIGVRVGASYQLHFIFTKTFTIELGASVHLWGPPLQGQATIHWWIISFTVSFGHGPNPSTAPIDWPTFYRSFLPQPPPDGRQPAPRAPAPLAARAAAPAAASPAQLVCGARAEGGLLQQLPNGDGSSLWVVHPDSFVFATQTAVPATEIALAGPGSTTPATQFTDSAGTGIRPMAQGPITSRHVVGVESDGVACDLVKEWAPSQVTNGVPSALWATTPAGHDQPPSSDGELLAGRLVGVRLSPRPKPPAVPTQIALADLKYEDLGAAPLPLHETPPPYDPGGQGGQDGTTDAWTTIEQTVTKAGDTRAAILQAARDRGVAVPLAVHLDDMAAHARLAFPDAPRLGALGAATDLATQPRSARPAQLDTAGGALLRPETPSPAPTLAQPGPRLRAAIRRYQLPGAAAPAGPAGGPLPAARLTGVVHSRDALSAKRSLRGLRGLVGGDGEAGRAATMRLHPGATLLWAVPDDGGSGLTCRFDGALPVRVVTFDRHHVLLADAVVGAGGPGSYPLPQGTAQLVVMGHASPASPAGQGGEAAPGVAGWQRSSSLILVNPVALLGERAVVRPQAPLRCRLGRRALPHGLTSGARLIAENRVQTARGERRGWLDTALPAAVRTVVVLVQRDPSAEAAGDDPAGGVQVSAFLARPGDGGGIADATLQASATAPGEAGAYRLVYPVPDPELQAGQPFLRVRVQPGAGWLVSGVIGVEAGEAEATARWSALTLQGGVASAPTDERVSRVELVPQE